MRQRLIAESAYYDNWERYYDPSIGRFVSSDPMGLQGGINTYSYAGDNPLTDTDPSGLLTIPFTDIWIPAGESYGNSAAEAWATASLNPANTWYQTALDDLMGGLASLWTPCTSNATAATLLTAEGAARYLGRPFWQYFPANNPGYESSWLTRGWGWEPPYEPGSEAARNLALPEYNPGDAVRPVNPPWWKFVGGPNKVPSDFGQPGGGTQYKIGGWP